MPRLDGQSKAALKEADILAVARARGINPRPSGRNYTAKCPFHKAGRERSASLTLYPDRGGYYCFACKTGGSDAVDFLRRYDNLADGAEGYYQAAEIVADICGITLTYDQGNSSEPSGPSHQDLRRAVSAAAAHYAEQLNRNPEALAYAESRGLTAPIRQRWGIGYACANHVQECGADIEHLVAAGVLRRRDDSSTYDPMHGRLVLCLHDQSGRTIAFAGRALSPDAKPKYVNTTDTPLYSKGRLLYAYHVAREILRRTDSPLYIVEGQLKALACCHAGIPAVAPGGTTCTPEQAALALSLTSHIRLSYDHQRDDGTRDTAGIKATADAAQVLRAEDALVDIARLRIPEGAPEGARDPDDLLAAGLPIEFDDAQDLVPWAVATIVTAEPGTPAWARAISSDVIDLIQAHPNAAVREIEIQALSRLTGISTTALNARHIVTEPHELPRAKPSAVNTDSPLTPGRLLCALALRDPAQGNDWQHHVPWCDLHPATVEALHYCAMVRARAESAAISIAAAIAEVLPADHRLRQHLEHWALAPLPDDCNRDLWPPLLQQITAAEHLRRIREGLL